MHFNAGSPWRAKERADLTMAIQLQRHVTLAVNPPNVFHIIAPVRLVNFDSNKNFCIFTSVHVVMWTWLCSAADALHLTRPLFPLKVRRQMHSRFFLTSIISTRISLHLKLVALVLPPPNTCNDFNSG